MKNRILNHLLGALFAFLFSFCSVGCLLTGFDLTIGSPAALLVWCAVFAVLSAVLWFFRYGVWVILLLSVLLFDSVYAIAWGAVISTLLSAVVNASPNRKLMGYGYLEQMKDVLPSIALSLVMFIAVSAVGTLSLPTVLLLMVQIMAGVLVYGALALLLKLEAARYLLDMMKKMLHK